MILSQLFFTLIQEHNPKNKNTLFIFPKELIKQELSFILNSYLNSNPSPTELSAELTTLAKNISLFNKSFNLDLDNVIADIETILKNPNDIAKNANSFDEQSYSFLLCGIPSFEQYLQTNFPTTLLKEPKKLEELLNNLRKKIILFTQSLNKLQNKEDVKIKKLCAEMQQRLSALEKLDEILIAASREKSKKMGLKVTIKDNSQVTLNKKYQTIELIFESSLSDTAKIHLLQLFLAPFSVTQADLLGCFFNIMGHIDPNTPILQQTIHLLITQKGLNPFYEMGKWCLYLYFPQYHLRKYIYNCVKESISNENQNNNNTSVSKLIAETSESIKISLITLFINLKDEHTPFDLALFEKLLNKTPDWENKIFEVPEISEEPSELLIEIDGDETLKLSMPSPSGNSLLTFAIFHDNENALKIMLNKRKFSFKSMLNAINYAVKKSKFSMLDLLLQHFDTSTPSARSTLATYLEHSIVFIRIFTLVAVHHKIPYLTFKKMLDIFFAPTLINHAHYSLLMERTDHYKDDSAILKLILNKEIINTDIDEQSIFDFILGCFHLLEDDFNNIVLFFDKLKYAIELLPAHSKFKEKCLQNEYLQEKIYLIISHAFSSIHEKHHQDSLKKRPTKNITHEYDSDAHKEANKTSFVIFTHESKKKLVSKSEAKKNTTKLILKKLSDEAEVKLRELIHILLKLPISYKEVTVTLTMRIFTPMGKYDVSLDILTQACMLGDAEILGLLFDNGFTLAPKHFSILASYGHTDCLKMTIDKNEQDFFFETLDGKNALENAILDNYIDSVKIIVDALFSSKFNYDKKRLKKMIDKAYKLTREDQVEIRSFLKEKLSVEEQKIITERNPHRIEFENIDNPPSENNNNNNAASNQPQQTEEEIEEKAEEKLEVVSVKKYQRFEFFNSKTQKRAIAYIKNDHWDNLHQQRDIKAFEESFLGHSKVRLVSISKNGMQTLKFRGYGDSRLLLLSQNKERILEIDQTQKNQPNDTEFYISELKPKHDRK